MQGKRDVLARTASPSSSASASVMCIFVGLNNVRDPQAGGLGSLLGVAATIQLYDRERLAVMDTPLGA